MERVSKMRCVMNGWLEKDFDGWMKKGWMDG